MSQIRFAACLCMLMWSIVLADEKPNLQFDLIDLSGKIHSPGQNERGVPRAYVFLSTTCPIANSYTAELNRLADEFKGRVEFFGVLSEPDVTRQDAHKHFEEFELRIPILFDA